MRGKVISSRSDIAIRITPAHAGKSPELNEIETTTINHPRTCGEKSIILTSSAFPYGSPPHMRGKEL